MRAQMLQSRPFAVPVAGARAAQPVRLAPAAAKAPKAEAAPPSDERLRLNNLSPIPGSRMKKKRKGRGYAAGQGGPCGFGMRGQNARSGAPTRPGFEGGQTPLWRRLPKLRGIAGGMPAGKPGAVTVNLWQLAQRFGDGESVDLAAVQERRIFKVTGGDRRLGLKVLAEGDLSAPLTVKAHGFSDGAKEKIEAAGGSVEVVPPARIKWSRKGHEKALREAGGKAPPKKLKGGDRGRPRNPWRRKDDEGRPLPNPGRAAAKRNGEKKRPKRRMQDWMKARNKMLKEQGITLPPPTSSEPKLGTQGGKKSSHRNAAPKKTRHRRYTRRIKYNS